MIMQTLAVAIIVVFLQQHIRLADGITCASNPCNLVAPYTAATGYCCYDIPPGNTDSVCSCPNSPPVVNGPCYNNTMNTGNCSLFCFNGGVCNIVNGEQVCWCALGFSGSNCELEGIAATRCAVGVCQAGVCVERTLGATVYAYCYCDPGWTGRRCDRYYFTCTQQGAFPDTANCVIGRYFYCQQASGAPIVATCPNGWRFNRNTSSCDPNYYCT